MLGKMLVYELPVPEAAILPLCVDIVDWKNHLERAVSLGLMEVTLINNGERLYRVPRILSPLLSFPEKEQREKLYQEATEILYRLWWSEVEISTEEQKLEIHRLSLLANNGDIAAKIAIFLVRIWIKISRFKEVYKICEDTLEIANDYHNLSNLARVEQESGNITKAVNYYQEALFYNRACSEINLGNFESAIKLLNDSIKFSQQIFAVQGQAKSQCLLGFLAEQQGEYKQAILHLQPALESLQRIQSPDAEQVRVMLARVQQIADEQQQ